MKKHAIVTGGAGFIGSHLCDKLLMEGMEVTAIDNLSTGRMENIYHIIGDKRFHILRHDVVDRFYISNNVDYIFHLASPASPVDYMRLPLQTMRAGAIGTMHMIDLARDKKAMFVLASTSEVYGDPKEHPQRETYTGNVNQIGPRSVYDEAKRYAESLTMAYFRYFNINTRIARIFNTYGIRMKLDDGRALPAFMSQALRGDDITIFGDGSQTRSFMHVSDLIEGLWKLANSDYHYPVNIGNPEEISILEFAHIIKKHTGSKSKIVFSDLPEGDPCVRKPDISVAKKQLDWSPLISLNEGLKLITPYFKERI